MTEISTNKATCAICGSQVPLEIWQSHIETHQARGEELVTVHALWQYRYPFWAAMIAIGAILAYAIFAR